MQQAKEGDSVAVHYKGTLDDGTVFDSSEGGDPIRFTIGSGQVIPGFEETVIGMSAGESKRERFPPEQAYGERQEDLIFSVARTRLEGERELHVGDVVHVGFADGTSAPMQVVELTDATVTLDANHPLAGKALTFDLELVSIG